MCIIRKWMRRELVCGWECKRGMGTWKERWSNLVEHAWYLPREENVTEPKYPEEAKTPKVHKRWMRGPVWHCKTSIMIWEVNGQDDHDYLLKAFPTTLWGIAIDWYTDLDVKDKAGWSELNEAFEEEFRLLRDDNKILAEICYTQWGKNESVRAYNQRLKKLLNKMEHEPVDGLKRWFMEGLFHLSGGKWNLFLHPHTSMLTIGRWTSTVKTKLLAWLA